MSCDFSIPLAEIEAVKPGDLVVVIYGSSRRYFIRHDDGTGDLIGTNETKSGRAGYAWDRTTSAESWATMMRAQRGDLLIIGHNMPRAGTPRDAALLVLDQVLQEIGGVNARR